MKDDILEELKTGGAAADAGLPEHLHGDLDDAVAAGGHRSASDGRRAARRIQDALESKGVLP